MTTAISIRNLKKSYDDTVALKGVDITIDDGELTPTLKIRRKQISENWPSVIESMYKD